MAIRVHNYQNSEYVGVDGSEILEAKCLKGLSISDDQFRIAIKGICDLWAQYVGRRSDAVVETPPHYFSSGSRDEYLFLLVDIWLAQINSILEHSLLPVFVSRKVTSPYVKGQVDFATSLVKNLGLIGPLESKVTKLAFNLPHLKVLRDVFELMACIMKVTGQGVLEKRILSQVERGLNTLKVIPVSGAPHSNAIRVASLRIKSSDPQIDGYLQLPRKLRSLVPAIDFAVDLILNSDFNIGPSGIQVNGLKFNLNYLLQFLLSDALSLNGGDMDNEVFKERKINNVRHFNLKLDIQSAKWMSPDCFGVIKNFNKGLDLIYILDAKHKSFFNANVELNKITREDFYQIISYASTHARQEISAKGSKEYFYGLIGLARETTITQVDDGGPRYITPGDISTFEITYDIDSKSVKKNVYAIPLKFAQLLYDIGASPKPESIKEIKRRLGAEILTAYSELNKDLVNQAKTTSNSSKLTNNK